MKGFLSATLAVVFGAAWSSAAPTKRQDAPADPATRTRVKIHPAQIRLLADTDWNHWNVEGDSTSSTYSVNDLDFTLASADGSTQLEGDYHKIVYREFVPMLGERLIGTGVTTNEDSDGGALVLTIEGLSEGEHTLLTWHNNWSNQEEHATLSISVNGEELASDVEQGSQNTNFWDAPSSYVTFTSSGDPVEVTYTPSGADNRVFLNGFEIDGPGLGQQISFPFPENKNERIHPNDGTVAASWTAPSNVEGATYDVYLGSDPDELSLVESGLSETQVSLPDLTTMPTYYWRVDVVSGEETYVGRVWMFRLAQLAFPGAEGYGRFARGGRGGDVVHVTSLEDSEEEGTLRYALTVAEGPRIVVFDVGGVITTESRMTVNSQYVTLAGQTAPGKGIVVQGHPLGLSGASDVIFRNFRVRPGTVSGQTVDGMGMQGSNHCIMDRCSISWGIDEVFSSRDAHNITLQRTMISEPLNVAGHKNYPEGTAHGYAATIGGDVGSFHHNLIAHAEGRSWSMGGGVDDNGAFAGELDIYNNVVYNFGTRVTDGGAHKVDFVGNYYKPGPASERTYALQATYEDQLPGTQQYHCAGNAMPGHFDQDSEQFPPGDGTSITEDIACYADISIDPPPDYQPFFDEPFHNPHIEVHTAEDAFKVVLSDSGAQLPVIDDHDQRIIQETKEGTTTYVGSETGKEGIIDNPEDVGGLEDYPTVTRDASWDADGDGIADWWDGSTGGEGYTTIEGYLNFMAEPHVFVAPGGSATIDLAALAVGFNEPSFEVTGATLGSVSVSGGEATYEAGEAGIDRLEIAVEDSDGTTWTRLFGVAVFEGAEDAQ